MTSQLLNRDSGHLPDVLPSDIPSALAELGIDAAVHGDEAMACCPSHPDRRPSWYMNTTSGLHVCHACGFRGTFPSLVSFIKGIGPQEYMAWVLDTMLTARQAPPRPPQHAPEVSESDLALFTPPPADALASRNLTGLSCQYLGILWHQGSWILPIRDPDTHKLWGWQEKNASYVRNRPGGVTKSRTLFGLRAFADGGTAVLVESPLDCARLHAAGITGGLSSYGVQVSDLQLSALRTVAGGIVFALDNDSPGRDKSADLAVSGRFWDARFLNYSACSSYRKDPGDMTDTELHDAVDNAVPPEYYLSAFTCP